MGSIRVLPPEIVNRIAAGEVIERPASVLKELVENSIDADSSRISVLLEDGGKQTIRIVDDGAGIEADDLPLAFASHATSKLRDEHLESNLFGVSTLGFRGEALASIQAVAMVQVVSRTPRSPHAWEYRPGDREPRPAAREVGTTIEVRNLFHNLPARRKFLRSGATELSHAVQQFTRLALSFPGIRFELSHGSKRLFQLPAVGTLRERLEQILGREAMDGLLRVEASEAGGYGLSGFVGNPRVSRKDSRDQHLFVNGRWVRDRLLGHALRAAYQGFQIPGNQPVAWVFLDVPPDELDVNVHPTKTEVRFRDPSRVYALVQGSVRDALSRPPGASDGRGPPVAASPRPVGEVPAPGRPVTPLERAFEEFMERADRARQGAETPWGRAAAGGGPARADVREDSARRIEGTAPGRDGPPAFQILDAYLVLETPEGLAIIDQHAFHEKIIFEEVLEKLERGGVESQRLLLPEVIDVAPEEMPLLNRAAEILAPLGFELEPFGARSLAVHAFPALFDRETGPTDLHGIVLAVLRDVAEGEARPAAPGVEGLGSAPRPIRDAVRRMAATIACRRAVKAGMRLDAREIVALLSRGKLARDPRNCPHGRPTAIFLARQDIEREFDRR